MIVCSSLALALSMWKLVHWDTHDHRDMDSDFELVANLLAWWGVVFYLFQALGRAVAAKRLGIGIMKRCIPVSLMSVGFLLALGLAASLEEDWSWKVEPVTGIVLATAMVFEGFRVAGLSLRESCAR